VPRSAKHGAAAQHNQSGQENAGLYDRFNRASSIVRPAGETTLFVHRQLPFL